MNEELTPINSEDKLPDCWEETEDPTRFWVRWDGQVIVFPVNRGLVEVDDGTYMVREKFREMLIQKLGPEYK